ncbi:MAG: SDR family oxidoreductase [Rhizobiaceae bacterium]|nr:SDR family oxidoreductase [Rhizobiaceae bacterium]
MRGRLEGKTAIVLGGSRGIGRAVVEAFVQEGAAVVLADVNDQLGTSLAGTFPDRVSYMHADIASRTDMQNVVQATQDLHGRIDILAQVAGIYPLNPIEKISEDEWDRVLAVNLKGPFLAIQACFPVMKRQRYGRIVLTGSITGPLVSYPDHAHYSASKAGLEGLARCAAIEGAEFGITVNVVAPGNVDTENVRAEVGDEIMDSMALSTPLKRLATPAEVAETTLFLASDAAAYMTGRSLVLDGGQTLLEGKL